jgi:hypothetical protein
MNEAEYDAVLATVENVSRVSLSLRDLRMAVRADILGTGTIVLRLEKAINELSNVRHNLHALLATPPTGENDG